MYGSLPCMPEESVMLFDKSHELCIVMLIFFLYFLRLLFDYSYMILFLFFNVKEEKKIHKNLKII